MRTISNPTTAQPKAISFGWLAAWTIASALGLALGIAGTLQLIWSMGDSASASIPAPLQGVIGGAILGLGIGFATGLVQWLVLRARGESSLRWLISTCIGGVVGGIVVGTLLFGQTNNGSNPLLVISSFALLGGFIGGVNFLMARDLVGSAVWIIASALGLAGASAILFGAPNSDLLPLNAVAAGLAYGILTAAALWWNHNK